MTDTPAVFDPKALQDRIAKSVQLQFGMLIPEDQFQGMVEKEVKAYFELETKFVVEEERRENATNHWNRDSYMVTFTKMTPFRRQVWDTIASLVRQSLNAKLAEELFRAEITRGWEGQGPVETSTLSTMLQEHLTRLAPKMVETMFQNMFAQAVSMAKQDIIRDVGARLGGGN